MLPRIHSSSPHPQDFLVKAPGQILGFSFSPDGLYKKSFPQYALPTGSLGYFRPQKVYLPFVEHAPEVMALSSCIY